MKFDLPKIVTSIVWLVIVLNLFLVFPFWLAMTLNILGAFLVVAHLIEYVVYREKIAQKPESALVAFIMTFLYGVFYWKS